MGLDLKRMCKKIGREKWVTKVCMRRDCGELKSKMGSACRVAKIAKTTFKVIFRQKKVRMGGSECPAGEIKHGLAAIGVDITEGI